MKFVAYSITVLIGMLLFLPRSAGAPMRNVPLLLLILGVVAVYALVGWIKYLRLMHRTRKLFLEHGYRVVKWRMIPIWRGHYGMTFRGAAGVYDVILLVRKRGIQYHFESQKRLELYRQTRPVFRNTKAKGPTIASYTQRSLVGRQRLLWRAPLGAGRIGILLFDALPEQISDSRTRTDMHDGARICDADVYLYDLAHLPGIFAQGER